MDVAAADVAVDVPVTAAEEADPHPVDEPVFAAELAPQPVVVVAAGEFQSVEVGEEGSPEEEASVVEGSHQWVVPV